MNANNNSQMMMPNPSANANASSHGYPQSSHQAMRLNTKSPGRSNGQTLNNFAPMTYKQQMHGNVAAAGEGGYNYSIPSDTFYPMTFNSAQGGY